ncbi:MerR family transcriptional regulator [Streptomyces bathyalis]|uniref:MerR family transcriptional regulator n=1 Tax=Streptomyces bathyalis TaxID=2710756 RepID=A0A7T1WUW9_9ACTN|nr:MerR family transcriptional regulator [Streptomyces bathyalis]QPP10059.1 MerR family transcriptional regulator [Streptomyces bathyalis]
MEHTPPGGAGDGAATGAGSGPLSIGGVLRVLREEFPEVTVSKIRFLETQGLVEPGRSPSGHRWFSGEDVERLRDVLRMQRDHYLPLRVIKEHLGSVAEGELPLPPTKAPQRSSPGTRRERPSDPPVRIGREQLLAAAGLTEPELMDCESHGLVSRYPDSSYDEAAVAVAGIVSELGRHGVPPRQLHAVKAAAEHQAGLLESAVASAEHPGDARTGGGAEPPGARLAALSGRLYEVFVQAALHVRPAEGPDAGNRPGE